MNASEADISIDYDFPFGRVTGNNSKDGNGDDEA